MRRDRSIECDHRLGGGAHGGVHQLLLAGAKAYTPHIDPAEFTTTIDNEYFPMKPGTIFVYEGRGQSTAR